MSDLEFIGRMLGLADMYTNGQVGPEWVAERVRANAKEYDSEQRARMAAAKSQCAKEGEGK